MTRCALPWCRRFTDLVNLSRCSHAAAWTVAMHIYGAACSQMARMHATSPIIIHSQQQPLFGKEARAAKVAGHWLLTENFSEEGGQERKSSQVDHPRRSTMTWWMDQPPPLSRHLWDGPSRPPSSSGSTKRMSPHLDSSRCHQSSK